MFRKTIGDKHSPTVTMPVDKLLAAIESDKATLAAGKAGDVERFFSYPDRQDNEKFPITLK